MRILVLFLCIGAFAVCLSAQGKTTIGAVFPPPSAASIVGGVTDHAVLAFTIQRIQGAPPTTMLTGVMPSMTGTATIADLVQWRLYADANANGAYDQGTDTQIGTASTTIAPSFTGFSMAVPTASALAMFITVDVAAIASNGATFVLQLTNLQITTSGGGRAGGPINSNAATIDNSAIPPVMALSRSATAIASASTDAMGNVSLAGQSFTYDVANTGTSNLVLTAGPAVQISGENNCTVVLTPPGTVVIAPSGATSFALLVTPLTAAAFSFNVSMPNNEPTSSQNPYTFSASGTGQIPAATQLVITQQPSNGTGGIAFGTQPIVEARNGSNVLDPAFTGLVTAAISTGTGTTGATLLGTVTISAAAGVATFNGLAIDFAGTGYTLTFTSASLTSATSSTFDITIGAAAQLTITVQPANSTGGIVFPTQPQVAVQDAGGNTLASDNSTSVNVAIRTGTGTTGATLAGTTALTVTAGVAAYTNLAINLEGAGYELEFTATGLTGAISSALTISIGPAAQLTITTQPGGSTGGIALSAQPVVAIQDAGGNTRISDNTSQVSVAIATGTGAAGAALGGTTTVTVASGVATFTNLSINLAGTAYQLEFSTAGLGNVQSSAFNITVGAAFEMVITTQPGNGTGGSPLFAQPVVELRDAGGNVLSGDNSSQIAAAITTGTGTGGAALLGTTTVTVSAGVGSFTNLAVDLSGSGYSLTFSSGSLSNEVSTTFNIGAGAAAQLAVTTQPSNGTGGLDLSTQPLVALQDSVGNTLTADNTSQITVAIRTGTGTSGATLLGTTTVTVTAGVATFTGLAIDLAGTGYELEFSSTGVPDEFSNAFDITIGAAAQLAIATQPGSGVAFQNLSAQPVVEIQDAGGNTLAANNTSQVAAAITTGTGTAGANLLGTVTLTVTAGVASYTNLGVDLAGTGYTLTFSSTGLADEISATFQVTAAIAAQLAVATQPGNSTGGIALSPQPVVELQDSLGNTLTADNTSQVSVTIKTGTGTTGAALLGTTTVTVSAGVATFGSLAIDLAGAGYVLTFSSTGLPDEDSATLDITVGAAASLRIATQPAGASRGVAFSTQPVVEIVDAGGNVVTTDNTTQVGATLLGTPGGMTLSGTTPVAAVAGVCTFTDLSINIAGGPIMLQFADTGGAFTAVDSSPFVVLGGGSSSGGGKGKGGDEGCTTGDSSGTLFAMMLAGLALLLATRRRARSDA